MSKTIGITLGDQSGIGPEVVIAALNDPRTKTFLGNDISIRIIGNTVPPWNISLGEPNLITAQASLDALEESVRLANAREIDAIVTAPVAKGWLHQVGFNYPGQTEFFANRLHCEDHAMCLTGSSLTVALVTIHVPLHTVPSSLTTPEIVRVGRLLKTFCQRRKQGVAPKIAVCGLNPHAGENGAFGKEDIEIITPAINILNENTIAENHVFTGPHPPDTVFKPAADGLYDAVLCMYHDQGLIPLKLLDFDTGVNTTLGLKTPRTSPDHGTAFDIAGKSLASHESMLHAIKLATDLVR